MLHEEISLIQGTAVDAEARVYLQAQTAADVEEITGQLYGPSCKFARTLAATFDIRPMEGAPASPNLSSVHVPDPCFWTPQLPFLYDLQITATRSHGESCDFEAAIAFKRWAADRKNWKLEGRRHVLRGAALREATVDLLSNGREVEAALFLSNPDEASLTFASREGVPLVVDLRESNVDQSHVLSWLAWSPAVFAAVVTAEQLSDRFESSPVTLPIGLAVDPRSKADDFESFDFEFYAAELDPGERPPTWLRTLEKPVIAIRRGEDYADLVAARAACDRLQAELAPEFDLAGYFVAP